MPLKLLRQGENQKIWRDKTNFVIDKWDKLKSFRSIFKQMDGRLPEGIRYKNAQTDANLELILLICIFQRVIETKEDVKIKEKIGKNKEISFFNK